MKSNEIRMSADVGRFWGRYVCQRLRQACQLRKSISKSSNENIKITIRFLTNEIRSDALDIKVFKKVCDLNNKCVVSNGSESLIKELKKRILKTAKIYEVQKKDKNFKPYTVPKVISK